VRRTEYWQLATGNRQPATEYSVLRVRWSFLFPLMTVGAVVWPLPGDFEENLLREAANHRLGLIFFDARFNST
jgi:hypothetical protein